MNKMKNRNSIFLLMLMVVVIFSCKPKQQPVPVINNDPVALYAEIDKA